MKQYDQFIAELKESYFKTACGYLEQGFNESKKML